MGQQASSPMQQLLRKDVLSIGTPNFSPDRSPRRRNRRMTRGLASDDDYSPPIKPLNMGFNSDSDSDSEDEDYDDYYLHNSPRRRRRLGPRRKTRRRASTRRAPTRRYGRQFPSNKRRKSDKYTRLKRALNTTSSRQLEDIARRYGLSIRNYRFKKDLIADIIKEEKYRNKRGRRY
jgi:hypothetical protein